MPVFLEKYFWDVDFKKIDFQQRKSYVLKRVLEFGDNQAVQWMWRNFKKEEIKEVLLHGRGFTKKSANFWALMLNVPKEKILCLKKHSLRAPKIIWPY